jgi:hypothetical protein
MLILSTCSTAGVYAADSTDTESLSESLNSNKHGSYRAKTLLCSPIGFM